MKCESAKCENVLSLMQEKNGQRFCCRSCSNSAVKRLASHESRRKVSTKIAGIKRNNPNYPPVEKVCAFCKNTFTVPFGKRHYESCSFSCGKKVGGIVAAKIKTERGTHSGWHNRRMQPSYPETYFMSLFENEGITGWQQELKAGRWFIDFAFKDLKLAVEIDGRQHEDEGRKTIDERKDAYLVSTGWTVFRIKWRNPKTKSGKDFLYPQIETLKCALGKRN